MPVGTYIQKRKYDLCYERNGLRVCDFSLTFYSIVFFVGIILLWQALRVWRKQKEYESR